MSSVREIEKAIEALGPGEFDELSTWLIEKREQAVDAAFEHLIASGKFDAMSDRALEDSNAGNCRPLMPTSCA